VRHGDDAPMKTITAYCVLTRIATRLRAWWQSAQQDEYTRFLSSADDLAHLERRQRALERGARC
jgi:hypothetical protein